MRDDIAAQALAAPNFHRQYSGQHDRIIDIIRIAPEALADIQDITDWYNQYKADLGAKFRKTAISHIGKLIKNPHGYAIRYHKIR